jgi:hypothetical protein
VPYSKPKGLHLANQIVLVVSDTGWKSLYELHAQKIDGRPSGTVFLNYNAQVTQCIEEDWADTVVKLSTASNDTNSLSTIPQPRSIQLELNEVM